MIAEKEDPLAELAALGGAGPNDDKAELERMKEEEAIRQQRRDADHAAGF